VGNYVTVAEVRAEGVPATVSDARIEARIAKWEQIVEQLTGNVFRVLEPGELVFDGNNMSILHFNLPLVSVSSVKINDETTALGVDEYRAYVGKTPPQDDRRNPKIELTPTGNVSVIFRSAPDVFLKGYDQRITAKWGFVDPDPATPGSYITPPAIEGAIVQLVCYDLDGYMDAGSDAARTKTRERTDGHEVEWSDAVQSQWASIPADVAEILKLYRRPQVITAPDPLIVADPSAAIAGY
jgi:hypothetical protein